MTGTGVGAMVSGEVMSGDPMNRIPVLMTETPQGAPSALPPPENTVKALPPTRNRFSLEPAHPDTLISDFWPP